MRVAVVGNTGYLAQKLICRFRDSAGIDDVVEIGRKNGKNRLELTAPDKFDYEILSGTDVVLFTAAISGPDQCADEYDYCYNVNVKGTSYFIKKAIHRNCKVIFFSSDGVFGNTDEIIPDENTDTDPTSPYGKMKNEIECEFKCEKRFKAIRLAYVVSNDDKFTKYCLACKAKGIPAEVFHPFYRNCISLSDVLTAVEWLVQNFDLYEPAFLNLAGEELVSRTRMADEIKRYYKDQFDYKIVSPDDSFFKNRPKITQMKSIYLYSKGIIEHKTFSEKYMKELEES